MMVSVIIPTKNEPTELVESLVSKLCRELRGIEHEIVVVDKSDEPLVLKNARVIMQKSDGLGNAILEGVSHAKGEVVVVMDSDGTHRAEDVPLLLKRIKECDVVIGSRYVEGSRVDYPCVRRLLSFLFNNLARFLLGLRVKDCMSGFVAVRKEVYEKIKLKPIGFKVNLELFYKASKLGLKVCEVPIVFLRRRKGKSKAGIGEVFRLLLYLVRIRLNI